MTMRAASWTNIRFFLAILLACFLEESSFAFAPSIKRSLLPYSQSKQPHASSLDNIVALEAAKGFGGGSSSNGASKKKKKKGTGARLTNALNDKTPAKKAASANMPYNKAQQQDLIEQLQAQAANSVLGQAVANPGIEQPDPFWELIPSLIASRFPKVTDDELHRVAGFLRHTLQPHLQPQEPDNDHKMRPLEDIHAYMPDLGPTQPFYDPMELEFCQLLSQNYDTILEEYHALLQDQQQNQKDRFQSVTSMNYESGWKTLVLFYNGHRIDGFPYHLCPTTTRLLETMPLAGRIAGFNRQQPQTGIPRHTDGNNMWLTCQMGLIVPPHQAARITVGGETRHWETAKCLLYDTTYWHDTFNGDPEHERVVLHVDFFNTLRMTTTEIKVLQYIYQLREQFMKAEGVEKVGAQIL